jgi:hypothetical protein
VEITAPSPLATTTSSLETRLRSPASRVTFLGQMQWIRRAASLWCQPSQFREPAKALKVISQIAHT